MEEEKNTKIFLYAKYKERKIVEDEDEMVKGE